MPTTLTLYRGEKSQWWPPPQIRLMSGMTLYQPWTPSSINSLWMKLKQEVAKQAGATVGEKAAAYAQHLRASGHPFALATARTTGGAFSSDYNYVIKVPNAHLFYWGGTKNAPDIGDPVPPGEQDNVGADYIVLNAADIGSSTILAFGHKTGTKEVTFVHDLPINFIDSCNNKKPASLNIKKKTDLTFDEKVKYGKFVR